MNYISFFFSIFLLTLLGCTPKHLSPLQHSKDNIDTIEKTTLDNVYSFPSDWLGEWRGKLNIYNVTGLIDKTTMALDISKTDTVGLYNWTISYGIDSSAQIRAYQLKEINFKTGHYLIDEKNGIFIDAYHIQNELISTFEVMGNTLIISYLMKKDIIEFNVKVFPKKEVRVSGNINYKGQDLPKVRSFELKSAQAAILYKKCLVE